MASSNTHDAVSPTTGTDPTPVMLSPEEVVQQLRSLRSQIPLETPPTATPKPRRLANVNPQFTTAAINAVGAVDIVQSAVGRSDEDLRQENDVAMRWTAVEDELRTLLNNVSQTNLLRRQRVGLAALQTYSICRQLARDTAHAPRLAAHISQMRQTNKFGRRSKKATDQQKPTDPQQPAPPQSPTHIS
jgi:hypothetical protein